MEQQVPELVDISDNEISSTRDNPQGTIHKGPPLKMEMRMKMETPDIPIQ